VNIDARHKNQALLHSNYALDVEAGDRKRNKKGQRVQTADAGRMRQHKASMQMSKAKMNFGQNLDSVQQLGSLGSQLHLSR